MLPEERDNREVEPFRRGVETVFQFHALTYVVVNVMLVAIWAATGAGYFWPRWPMIGWGPAVAIHAWLTYARPRD